MHGMGSGIGSADLRAKNVQEQTRADKAPDVDLGGAELNIQVHFERFLDKKITATMDLSLADMEINPFMIAVGKTQLGIDTPEDLARVMIAQWLERSMATSFGSTLQSIAREFADKDPPRGLTARLVRDGITYNMIIKAGPSHNVQVARNIRQVLLRYKDADPDSVPVFGSCYGRVEEMGQIMKKEMAGIRVFVGRRFWEFLSLDAGCYEKISHIASQVGASYENPDAGTLENVIEKKAECIAAELKEIYGNGREDFWRRILGGRI